MKILTQICRVLVGVLFIISGLIKLNDPVGFSFKLEEYFSENVLNLTILVPYALALAVVIVIFEVLLGVMLLVGFKRKFTLWSLLIMIVFFTFLTLYSAVTGKVTDCGCFGDALHLTPWQSFTKDVILLVLILVVFINKKHIKKIFKKPVVYVVVAAWFVGCSFFAYHVLNHLPVIDFRAYKVGTVIREGMAIPEGAPKSEYAITFIYKVNGVEKEFTDKELDKIPADAEYVDRKEVVVKEGYVPPIHDFVLEFNGEDMTDAVLDEPKVVLVISYFLEKAEDEGLAKIQKFANDAKAKGYKVIGLTASGSDVVDAKKKQHGITMDYYTCDATTLKTIERANPSIVVLKQGVVAQKAHWRDMEFLQLK